MENKELLKKISSKYILKTILSYIKDLDYPFILFIHSHYFINKLGLNYIVFQKQFFNNLGIDLFDYIYLDYSQFTDINSFDKNILKKNLEQKLSKLNIDYDIIKHSIFIFLKIIF